MKDYTRYCTKEQTIRAYKLGAPLNIKTSYSSDDTVVYYIDGYVIVYKDEYETRFAEIPTTQQMFNWLRGKNLFFHIEQRYGYEVITLQNNFMEIYRTPQFLADNAAELATIDAALLHIEGKDKCKEKCAILESINEHKKEILEALEKSSEAADEILKETKKFGDAVHELHENFFGNLNNN